MAHSGHGRHASQAVRPKVDYDTSAEGDGRRAFQNGLPLSCVPYRGGWQSASREAWERGWRLEALTKVETTNDVKMNWNEQRKQRGYGAEPGYKKH